MTAIDVIAIGTSTQAPLFVEAEQARWTIPPDAGHGAVGTVQHDHLAGEVGLSEFVPHPSTSRVMKFAD
jgi:hypothetical protein